MSLLRNLNRVFSLDLSILFRKTHMNEARSEEGVKSKFMTFPLSRKLPSDSFLGSHLNIIMNCKDMA